MKSKDLIAELQKLDPSGEIEVCCENLDISRIGLEPAYYDGALQTLLHDENGRICGAKYKRNGSKIVLCPLSISDAIHFYEIENNIDYSELSEDRLVFLKEYHKRAADFREKIEEECEIDLFLTWAKEEALKITEDIEDIKNVAILFYTLELSHDDPIKIDRDSYNNTRLKQWNEKYKVQINENGSLEIVVRQRYREKFC